jgi:hypothetical protein
MNYKAFFFTEKSEKILFFLLAVANLYPVLSVKYVGSLDGPQHLYVSNVVAHLWRNNEFYHHFFKLNSFIIGNSFGSYLLSFFNLFLVDWLAEKALIVCYLLGLVYAFRYLIISINGKSSILSFLVFPFGYTSLFMLGYYNYSIAIAVMMWALGYWIRIENKLSAPRLLGFSLLVILLYYSHIFVFVFFLMSLGLYYVFNSVIYAIRNKREKELYKKLIVKALLIALSTLPAIVIGFFYMKSITGKSFPLQLTVSELTDSLFRLKILIGYVTKDESAYTSKIFILICLLIIIQLVLRFIKYGKRDKESSSQKTNWLLFEKQDFWLLLSIVLLAFYYFVPERLSAGNISARIFIILAMVILVWISVQDYPKIVSLISVLIIAFLTINIYKIHSKALHEMESSISEIREVSDRINDSSVYVTANYSEAWLHYHFQSYVGSEKFIIDINSPGCSDQFAINWNLDKRPFAFIGSSNASLFSYVYLNSPRSKSTVIAEYAVILGYREFTELDMNDSFKKVLLRNYRLVYRSSSGFVALYRLVIKNEYQEIEKELADNPKILMHVRSKAQEYMIPVEEMLRRDALWILSQRSQ